MAYVEALQEIQLRLSQLDYSKGQERENRDISISVFKCDVACLQEFDPQCALEDIYLPVEKVDAFAKHLLTVLQHAQLIGHSTHAEIFCSSLHQALLILKECDMDTKLASLDYCHNVLQTQSAVNWKREPDVAHYAQLTLEAIYAMWSMVAKWLETGCMSRQELKRLDDSTQQLLLVLKRHGAGTLQLGYLLLNEVLGLPEVELHSALLESISHYLQELLDHSTSSPDQLVLLHELARSHWRSHPAHLLPLMSSVAVKSPESRKQVIESLTKGLVHVLERKEVSVSEWRELTETLKAFRQLELLILRQCQDRIVEQEAELSFSVLARLPLQCELPKDSNVNWNSLSVKLLEKEKKCASETFLEVCSLLMQVTYIRQSMKSQTQHQLLAVLERHMEMSHLYAIRLETPSSAHTQMKSFYAQHFQDLIRSNEQDDFWVNLPLLYIAGYVKPEQLIKSVSIAGQAGRRQVIRLLICSSAEPLSAFKVSGGIELYCPRCQPLPEKLRGIFLGKTKQQSFNLDFSSAITEQVAKDLLYKSDSEYIAKHLDSLSIDPNLILRLLTETKNMRDLNERSLSLLVPIMTARSSDFMQQWASFVLGAIKSMLAKPLEDQEILEQRALLRVIIATAYPEMEELWLFHWFKMTFFLLVHIRSLVAQEAVLAATEMCASHGLQTINLWNWYRRDALDLVVRLALTAYLSDGVRFTRSLRAVSLNSYSLVLKINESIFQLTKMLGFSCVQEFTCKYHRLLTAMVLPHCIVEPRCKGVLVLIAKQLRKPIATLFSTSFLRIYTHVYLTEDPELANNCIELVVSCTQSSLQQLMNADVKVGHDLDF